MGKSLFAPKEVANILGISKQTLLRYEKKRIFPPSHRSPINKRREYTPKDIAKLRRILGRV
ncbi:MAG: MerR family transcriptional regulator [Candidatus Omnitrophica bacterium]|nr:MerR family transcriptional regulator [Candidatus Omnitrophota bacterium]MBU4472659.1 MerR family transcriptional regulator [Candidatus Omnitrophota bacterium]MCG2706417.1 MerR family transcriptional regulator [Candidatus Omnitrophota bacterium]